MKILFTTDYPDSLSSVLNAENFAQLNSIEGISIDFGGDRYQGYDVILFMGYDQRTPEAKKINPNAFVGVIDPRPGTAPYLNNVDFLVVNGIEMRDYYADRFSDMYTYPIYTKVPVCSRVQRSGPVVLGYHGNKANLHLMHPGIFDAIRVISREHEIVLKLFYNIKGLGEIDFPISTSNLKVECIQFSEEGLSDFGASVDIGLVPNVIPVVGKNWATKLFSTPFSFYNENSTELLLRYKATANPGRIFLFAQAAVPVVAGALPSTCTYVRDGEGGYVATSSAGWYWAIKRLVESPSLRQEMGTTLQQNVMANSSIDILNSRFVKFLRGLKHQSRRSFVGKELSWVGSIKLAAAMCATSYMRRIVRKTKTVLSSRKNM